MRRTINVAVLVSALAVLVSVLAVVVASLNVFFSGALPATADVTGVTPAEIEPTGSRRRRLTANGSQDDVDGWFQDVPYLANLAKKSPSGASKPFRVLFVITSLVEFDKGTRGTEHGYDRLQNIMLPPLVDGVKSMTDRGWEVDLYLVLGFKELLPERRKLIQAALPDGVGLEVWDNAIPFHYAKTYNKRPQPGMSLSAADHALSRQHRFVLRDKLQYYDFFCAFEDDIKITADHVVNFLELSNDIYNLHRTALSSVDRQAHVVEESPSRPDRHQPNDKSPVGNDVVDDPLSAEFVKRLFPGLLRVEVLDRKEGDHPLRNGRLERHQFKSEVPPSPDAYSNGHSLLRPVCCEEAEPARGRMTANPIIEEVVLWETNIQASGVRNLPEIGWVHAMPVEDRADIGSYWSGYPSVFGEKNVKRPRRVDATLGQQAGFMATRKQVEYFHTTACPGGFLPPYDDQTQWKGDSLQRHSVEFWSGGFQLFGQCFLNRIVPLDPRRFERQLLYHVSNNKQRSAPAKKFIRVGDFYGQLMRVKEKAEDLLKQSVR